MKILTAIPVRQGSSRGSPATFRRKLVAGARWLAVVIVLVALAPGLIWAADPLVIRTATTPTSAGTEQDGRGVIVLGAAPILARTDVFSQHRLGTTNETRVIYTASSARIWATSEASPESTLFYSDGGYGTQGRTTNHFHQASLDGTDGRIIHTAANNYIAGLAADLAAGFVYGVSRQDVFRIALDGSGRTTIAAIQGGFSLDLELDLVRRKLYWVDGLGNGRILRANLDGTGLETIVTGLNTTEGITLDVAGGKIYFAVNNGGTDSIDVANLNGSERTTFVPLPNGADPFDVAIDSAGGLLFWEQRGGIYSVPLAGGSPPRTVIEAGHPSVGGALGNGIAFDPVGRALYFGYGRGDTVAGPNAGPVNIGRVNPDGTGFTPVLTDLEAINYIHVATANLPIHIPPEITSPPLPASVAVGQPAGFSVTAVGAEPLAYQWYRSGHEVLGATSETLSLAAVTAGDAGEYTVEVANPLGRTLSAPAVLTVTEPPTITQAPVALTVQEGRPARFAVVAAGTGPLSYQWLRDGVPLGVPSLPTLTLDPVQLADHGAIAVRVGNSAGTADSVPVPLRVLAPVRFIREPQGATLTLNPPPNLALDVEVAGTTPFAFQWRLNGQDIPDATNAVYTVPVAGLKDAGIYTVVAVNEAGAVTSETAEVRFDMRVATGNDAFVGAVGLNVLESPVGGNNTGTQHVAGEPDHAAKAGESSVWYRWTAPGPGRMTFRTLGSAFDTLLAAYTGESLIGLAATEVASSDDVAAGGFFTSEVTFNAVAGTTYSVVVDGLGAAAGNYVLGWDFVPNAPPVPQITVHPANQTQTLGERVEVRVSTANPADITWRFNGRPVTNLNGTPVSGSPLVLPSVQPAHVGTYVAVVSGGGFTVYSHPATVELGPQADAHSYDKPEELGTPTQAGARVGRQGISAVPALALGLGRTTGTWVNNETYTTQLGETNHCGMLVRRTGWLLVGVQNDGHLLITATNTIVPVVLALYPFGGSQALACGTNGTLVFQNARTTELYEVMYGSTDTTGGLIGLDFIVGVPPPEPPPDWQSAPPADVPPGDAVTLDAPVVAGVVPAPKHQWYRNGEPIPGATGAKLVLPAFTAELAGEYSVGFDNGVGQSVFPVGTLRADLPAEPVARDAGFTGGRFTLPVRGNSGQRVAVDAATVPGGQDERTEFWLPAGGTNYVDLAAPPPLFRFYTVREVPVRMERNGDYTDGRRRWRVAGGRLGKSYSIEVSDGGESWTPTGQTNQVEAGAFHWIVPATDNRQYRARTVP